MKTHLRLATRESALALAQTDIVKHVLSQAFPELTFSILGMTTEGDRRLDESLAKIGGKGLFIKELEYALLNNQADLAVHSMKDLPMELPESLILSTILKREDPRDAFISNHFSDLNALPKGAVIGTSSLRRQCLIKSLRPDLTIRFLRGNLTTRLAKLDAGDYDAIILAAAGLNRLALNHRIKSYFDESEFVPAPGQGAIGIECRNNPELIKLLSVLSDPDTTTCVLAERAVSRHLQASCHTPLGAFAYINNASLHLRAVLGDPTSGKLYYAEATGPRAHPQKLGIEVAEKILLHPLNHDH